MNKLYRFALLFISLLTFMKFSSAQVSIETAKDFTVKDLASNQHRLFDYLDAGKIVVLDFFTISCGPCQTYASHVSEAYEYFGCNQGNVIFLGINWGADNDEVLNFDTLYGVKFPSVSGLQGGGNAIIDSFEVRSYPSVCVITPDRNIFTPYIWLPAYDSIVREVTAAGGMSMNCTVSMNEIEIKEEYLRIFQDGGVMVNLPASYKDVVLSVYSLDGKHLYSEKPRPNTLIRTPERKGFYILRLASGNKLLETRKFVRLF